MLEQIAQEPIWLKAWIYWLVVVNSASIVFVKRKIEARWVLAAWIGNLVFMAFLYDAVGYVRLLGLSHVLFWTPLVIYLFRRLKAGAVAQASGMARIGGVWLRALVLTNLVSLVVDYVDVGRYVVERRQERRLRDALGPVPRSRPGRSQVPLGGDIVEFPGRYPRLGP